MKKILAIILTVCVLLCVAGCAEGDVYDTFEPVGVQVVESVSGLQYETNITDKAVAKKMWNKFEGLEIDTEAKAEMGSAYIYMCFYNKDESALAIFTIYENGACCLGEDFKTFYTVDDGRKLYVDLCDIYTEYESERQAEEE